MGKAYALFDFDGTLISGDSFVLFCCYALKKKLCGFHAFARSMMAGLRYLLGQCSAEESKTKALAFLKGLSQADLRQFSQNFCEDVLRPRLRSSGLAELEKRQKEGAEILLITASPAFYLEPLKDVLGAREIIGTRLDFGNDGKATGLICGENCKGLQKPLRLAEYLAAAGDRLDFDHSYAYGDSASDMPMLALCAHKVGVNAKQKLKKELKRAEGAEFVRW